MALHARSVIRREQDSQRADLMPQFAWQAGHIVAVADHMLERLNTPWHIDEVGTTESELWAAQLREGLDVFARICWCLRFGHTFAAVALTRRFIERWTYNLAFSTDVAQDAKERDQDYVERVWSAYAARVDPRRVASDWSALSELLHGRAATLGANPLSRITLAAPVDPRRAVHDFVVRACEAPFFQVCASVNTVAAEHGVMTPETHALLLARPADFPSEPFPKSMDPEAFLSVFHEPLTVEFVRSEGADVALSWGETYRSIIRARAERPLALTQFHSWMSLEERWVRTIEVARYAFELEEEILGSDFDPGRLRTRVLWYQVITEVTELAAGEVDDAEHANALRTAAAALESAWILWLQDVDDSLTCMRGVLEAVAKARTYRLKPRLAEKLTLRGRGASPHRWLDAAGWGRLSAFARSLGEFAHIQERSRHSGSRELLTSIQENAPVETAALTGRGSALERVAMLLGTEIAATLETLDPEVASACQTVVLGETSTETEASLAEWLDRVFRHRDHNFGDADYSTAEVYERWLQKRSTVQDGGEAPRPSKK
ncbi:hypothetical protein [Microbacterium sp. Gd 4-13]|uniref:hypothetical protein n=1 Tax=Microbacterium sp. Gd 4-13 TaxID=2173179 RepID=UPI0010577E94|nr:hypothetical protein [Microbacterium sp. Gd 4-13]